MEFDIKIDEKQNELTSTPLLTCILNLYVSHFVMLSFVMCHAPRGFKNIICISSKCARRRLLLRVGVVGGHHSLGAASQLARVNQCKSQIVATCIE